jgi:hypothetical protein
MTLPCKEWVGAKSKAGYGQKWADGRTEYIHRLSWRLERGPIPPGLCVLHQCDNRACYEVSHLFLGTKADNTQDMMRKRRHRPGNRKFSADVAGVIRCRVASGERVRTIAKDYGVATMTIYRIKLQQHYRPRGDEP